MLIFLIVIIGLSLLILGHEAGHFFVARLFRLKIDEFGFGFPPRIFAWRHKGKMNKEGETLRPFDSAQGKQAQGETEYSLNWLPFGGFVKIAGENDRLNNELEKLTALSPEEKKQYFLFQPAWKRALVIVAGVLVNFAIGWLLLSSVFAIGTPSALVISSVQPGSPAEKAGFLSGDVIKNFSDSAAFLKFIDERRGQEITLDVKRGGKNLNLAVTPRLEAKSNEGSLGVYYVQAGIPKHNLLGALGEGLKQSFIISKFTVIGFYELVKNLLIRGRLSADIVGPVGIFSIAEQAGSIGFIYLIQLISLISLNLAVINLIPFPALDGGRLFMILIEKVKGSSISLKTESLVNGMGFVLLIALMIVITVRDIARWF